MKYVILISMLLIVSSCNGSRDVIFNIQDIECKQNMMSISISIINNTKKSIFWIDQTLSSFRSDTGGVLNYAPNYDFYTEWESSNGDIEINYHEILADNRFDFKLQINDNDDSIDLREDKYFNDDKELINFIILTLIYTKKKPNKIMKLKEYLMYIKEDGFLLLNSLRVKYANNCLIKRNM